MISIVVPIYNVEEYLPKCLESIINQSYRNIEIILVDDGSPDNAGEICDEYATKDERVRVFHIPNGGVAKARQLGIENSTGDYIVFVDPDDWLPLDSIEILYSNMRDDVDIVIGGIVYKSDRADFNRLYTPAKINKNEFIVSLLTDKIEGFPWRSLYRKSLFDFDCFPSIKRRQDLLMNIKLSRKVNNVVLIDKIVYYYFQRDNSTSYQYKYDFEYEKGYYLMLKQQLDDDGMLNTFFNEYIQRSFQSLRNVFKAGNLINIEDRWVNEIIDNVNHSQLSISEKNFITLLHNKSLQRVVISCCKMIYCIKQLIKKVLRRR
ncbi:MAG: glycosyltransferase family 2 protein [Rikenellaceae bacterium]